MSELREALLRLRDLLRSQGVPWGEGMARETVAMRVRAAGVPEIDDLLTWFEICPNGACLCPNGLVLDLETILEDHVEMVFIAKADFPSEASSVTDWVYLTRMEHGGYSLCLADTPGERPVVWRTEVRGFEESWIWRGGLSALVNGWYDAFVRGVYYVDHGRPEYVNESDLSDPRRANWQI